MPLHITYPYIIAFKVEKKAILIHANLKISLLCPPPRSVASLPRFAPPCWTILATPVHVSLYQRVTDVHSFSISRNIKEQHIISLTRQPSKASNYECVSGLLKRFSRHFFEYRDYLLKIHASICIIKMLGRQKVTLKTSTTVRIKKIGNPYSKAHCSKVN